MVLFKEHHKHQTKKILTKITQVARFVLLDDSVHSLFVSQSFFRDVFFAEREGYTISSRLFDVIYLSATHVSKHGKD